MTRKVGFNTTLAPLRPTMTLSPFFKRFSIVRLPFRLSALVRTSDKRFLVLPFSFPSSIDIIISGCITTNLTLPNEVVTSLASLDCTCECSLSDSFELNRLGKNYETRNDEGGILDQNLKQHSLVSAVYRKPVVLKRWTEFFIALYPMGFIGQVRPTPFNWHIDQPISVVINWSFVIINMILQFFTSMIRGSKFGKAKEIEKIETFWAM